MRLIKPLLERSNKITTKITKMQVKESKRSKEAHCSSPQHKKKTKKEGLKFGFIRTTPTFPDA